jgi:hypothetical protein
MWVFGKEETTWWRYDGNGIDLNFEPSFRIFIINASQRVGIYSWIMILIFNIIILSVVHVTEFCQWSPNCFYLHSFCSSNFCFFQFGPWKFFFFFPDFLFILSRLNSMALLEFWRFFKKIRWHVNFTLKNLKSL